MAITWWEKGGDSLGGHAEGGKTVKKGGEVMKTKVKSDCDCWIAILIDYDQDEENNLYISSYKQKLIEKASQSRRFNIIGINPQQEVFKSKDYIDGRKGLATLFTYCPLCGKKIDWRKLRKAL